MPRDGWRRLEAVERHNAAAAGEVCEECGHSDDPNRKVEFEVIWDHRDDEDNGEPEEEFCSTCGHQTHFVVVWPEDLE